MADRKKNLLLILSIIPCETGNGAQRRAAAHIKSLSVVRNIYLIIFEAIPGRAKPIDSALAELCEYIKVIPGPERPRKIISSFIFFMAISEIISPRIKRIIPNDRYLIEAFGPISHINFDEAFCVKTRIAVILERMLKVTTLKVKRKIVDYDDIESLVQIRSDKIHDTDVGFEVSLVKKMTLWQQKYIENKFLRTFDHVLICSEDDKRTLDQRNPIATVHVIPNGVPIDEIYDQSNQQEMINILFVGSMSYGPNEDGVLWFFDKIYNSIREKTNIDFSIFVVGFYPSQKVLDLQKNENVTVTGGVPSVIPYYQKSNFVIAPIRYGGGTRIKILEAMSLNRAVVSTTIGAEGLDVENGKDIIIADTPDEFADSCIKLIENDDFRSNISIAGRKTVEEKYSSQIIEKTLRQLFD